MSGSIHGQKDYFIPEPSVWPITAMASVFLMLAGTALTINGVASRRLDPDRRGSPCWPSCSTAGSAM